MYDNACQNDSQFDRFYRLQCIIIIIFIKYQLSKFIQTTFILSQKFEPVKRE